MPPKIISTVATPLIVVGMCLTGCGKKDAPAVADAPPTPARAAVVGVPPVKAGPTAGPTAPDPNGPAAAGSPAVAGTPGGKKVPPSERRVAGAGGRPLPKAAIDPGDRAVDRMNQLLEAARKRDAGN